MQFAMIKVLSLARDDSALEKTGRELFRFWASLRWSKLYQSDQKAKQVLQGGAQTLLGAGLSAEDAGPIMVLLLCSIYEFTDYATIWASSTINQHGNTDKIPNDLLKAIDSYFG